MNGFTSKKEVTGLVAVFVCRDISSISGSSERLVFQQIIRVSMESFIKESSAPFLLFTTSRVYLRSKLFNMGIVPTNRFTRN